MTTRMARDYHLLTIGWTDETEAETNAVNPTHASVTNLHRQWSRLRMDTTDDVFVVDDAESMLQYGNSQKDLGFKVSKNQ